MSDETKGPYTRPLKSWERKTEQAAPVAGDLDGTCVHGVMRRYYACQQCGDKPDGEDILCWMIVHNGTKIAAWTTSKPVDTYSDEFEVIPLGKAATIAALRTDLAYYQAKWEHELTTVSKLERERDALRQANKDCVDHFEALKVDYDALRREVEK